MRRAIVIVTVLALALLAAPVFAEMTVIWDRYDRATDSGVCLAMDSNGTYWIVRYRDGNSGTPGQFDPGLDHVYGRHPLRQHR